MLFYFTFIAQTDILIYNPKNMKRYNSKNKMKEQLYYKEDLYVGRWYIVTSIFTFQDSKLVKQEMKEEKMFE